MNGLGIGDCLKRFLCCFPRVYAWFLYHRPGLVRAAGNDNLETGDYCGTLPPLSGYGIVGPVEAQEEWKYVAGCGARAYGIKSDGSLWGWGTGALGDGTISGSAVPVFIHQGPWMKVSTNSSNGATLAIKEDGTMWSWGLNAGGQLGIGRTGPPPGTSAPKVRLSSSLSRVDCSDGGMYSKTPSVSFFYKSSEHPYYWDEVSGPGSGVVAEAVMDYSLYGYWIDVDAAGSGYTSIPLVRVVEQQSPPKEEASVSLTVRFQVVSVEVQGGGSGYSTPPVVTVPGVSGFQATAVISGGTITAIEIQSPGLVEFSSTGDSGGQRTLPVTIAGAGAGASALAKLGNGFIVKGNVSAAGGGYRAPISLEVAGSGRVSVRSNGKVIGVKIHNGGSGYTNSSTKVISVRFNRDPQDAFTWGGSASGTPALVPAQATVEWEGDLSSYLADPFFTGRDGRLLGFSFAYTPPANWISVEARIVGGGLSWEDGIPVSYSEGMLSYDGSSEVGFYAAPYIAMKISISTTANTAFGPLRPILRHESDDDPRKAIEDAWDVEYSGGRQVLNWNCGISDPCFRETITKETGDLIEFVNGLKGEAYAGSVVASSGGYWGYYDGQTYSTIAGEPELVVSPEGAEFELFDVFDGTAFFNQTSTGGEYRRASSSDLPAPPPSTDRCGHVTTYSGNKRITVDYENISVTLAGHSVEPYFIARSTALPQGAFPHPKSSPGRAFFTFGDGREQGSFSVGLGGLQVHRAGGYWTKEPTLSSASDGVLIPQQIPGQWIHCEADALSAVSSSGIVYRWNPTIPKPEDMGRPAEIAVSWNKDSVPSRDQMVRSEYEIRGFRNFYEAEIAQRFFTMSPPQAIINGAAAAIQRTKRLCYEYRFFPDELPNDYFWYVSTKSSDEKSGFDGEAQVMLKKRPGADCFLNDFSTPPLTVYSTGAGYRSPPEILFSRGGDPLVEVTTSLAEVPAFLETRSNYALTEGGELWHLGGGWRVVDFDYKIVARKATFEASPLYDSFFILASTSNVLSSDSDGNERIWKSVSPYFWWNNYNYFSTVSPACITTSPVNHETVESVDAVVGYVIVFDNGGSGFDNYSQWTIRVTLPQQLSLGGAFPFYYTTTAEKTVFGSMSPRLPSFPDKKGYKLAKWGYDEGRRIASCRGHSPWDGAEPQQSQYNFPEADFRTPSSVSHTTEYAITRSQGNVTSHSASPWMGSLIPPSGLAPGILYFNSISDLNEEPTVEFLCTGGSASYGSLPSYRVIPVTGYLQSLGGQQKVDGSWSDFQIESGDRKLYRTSFPTYTGFPAPGSEAEFVKTNGDVGLKSDGSLWRLGSPGVSPSRVMGNLELKVASPGGGYKSPPMAEVSPQLSGVATATATFDGKIVAVGIDSQGSGYRSPPQLTVSGGGQLQAVILGPVDAVNVTAGGGGYRNPPRVIFSTPGCSASGKASMKGSVSSVWVVDGGEGYSSPPSISMGGNATATAAIKGYIQNVIVNAGGLYSSAPSVSFSGGGGSGASAVAVMTRSGDSLRVSSIVVTNTGSGYTSSPTVNFSGDGGAAATAVLNASVDSVSLTSGGSGYEDHPSVSVDGNARRNATLAAICSLGVDSVSVVDGGSYRSAPTASFEAVGEISSVSLTSGGGGYFSAPEVKILGGLGSGAEAACTISASIESFVVANGGSGYLYPPYVLISGGRRPSQSTQATATATLGGGAVVSISVEDGGSGYYEQPTVAFKFPESAIANASVTNGSVSGVEVLSGGCWYTDPPQVVFEGSGTGAAATAQVQNGVITSVNITSGGSGYSAPPKVGFSVPRGGRGAQAAAVLSGEVDSISLISCGVDYDQDALPEVLFIGGGGAGASASLAVSKSGSGGSATTTINGSVIYAKIIDQGSGYQDEPTVTVSESANFIIQKAAQDLADEAIDQEAYNEIVDSARAVVRAGVAGRVSGVTIQNAGQHYAPVSGRTHNQHGERKPSGVTFRGPRLGEYDPLAFASTQASTSTSEGGGGAITAVSLPQDFNSQYFTRRPTVHFCDTIGVSLSTRARVSSAGVIKGSQLDSRTIGGGSGISTLFPSWYGYYSQLPFVFESSPSLPLNSNYGGSNECVVIRPSEKYKAGSTIKGAIHQYDFSCSSIRAATFSGKFVRFPRIGVESSVGAREQWSISGGGEIEHFQDVPFPGQQKHSSDIQVIVLDPGVAEVLPPQFQVSVSGGAVVSVAANGPARSDSLWGAGELVVHGGGGSGARLSLSVSNEAMTVYVLDGGSGYTSTPSVKWVLPQQAYGFRMPDGSSPYPADDSKWKTRRPVNGYLSLGEQRVEYVTGSTGGGYVSIIDNDPFARTNIYAFYKDGFVSDASLLDAGYLTHNFDGPAFLKHYTSPPSVTLYGGSPEEQASVQPSVVKWTDKFSGKDGLCVAVRDTAP